MRPAPLPARTRPTVVTGASSGIGRATAVALAEIGHPVILGARRIDECSVAASAIAASGGRAIALPLDLADVDSVESFSSSAVEAFGPIDVVVSNAAQILPGTALDTDPETFRSIFEVNVLGAHRIVRAFVPAMVTRGRGDVVFITSDVVMRPRPAMIAYVSSKWGLEGYVRALQMEWEGSGVRASIVRPGPTATGMGIDWDAEATTDVLAAWESWGLARHGSFLRPEGIAGAVVTTVSAPPGVHIQQIDVQPEAPVNDDR